MSFTVQSPFSEDQQKSINTYQKDGLFHPMVCKCGGKIYGTVDGLVCNSCYEVEAECPRFITNWMWKSFNKSKEVD